MKKSLKYLKLIILLILLFGCSIKNHIERFQYIPPVRYPVSIDQEPILKIDNGGHMDTITGIMYSKNGKYIISASHDKTVRVWDTESGLIKNVIRGQIGKGNAGSINAVALSQDNRFLAVAGYPIQYGIRIYDLKDFNIQNEGALHVFNGHCSVVTKLLFIPKSLRFVSASTDSKAIVWDIESGDTLFVLKGHEGAINDLCLSPDGKKIVTASSDNMIKIWDSNTGKCITSFKNSTNDDSKVLSVRYSPDGLYIISGSSDNTIKLWQVAPGFVGRMLNFGNKKQNVSLIKTISQNYHVQDLSISSDGNYLLSCNGTDVVKYSLPDLSKLITFDKHKKTVLTTCISPDGRQFASAVDSTNEINIWNIDKNDKSKMRFAGQGSSIMSVGYSTDGKSIAWGKSYDLPNVFKHGSLEQQFILNPMSLGKKYGCFIEGICKVDGFMQGIDNVGLYSIRTKNHPNSHKTLQILKKNLILYEIEELFQHKSLTLTHDGNTVISGGLHGRLEAYNTRTKQKIHTFDGHSGTVWGVAVSPDNKILISGSSDQTVKIWNMISGKNLLTIFNSNNDNQWVAWTPDGYYTSSVDGEKYLIWHINRGLHWSSKIGDNKKLSLCYRSPKIIEKVLRGVKISFNDLESSKQCYSKYISTISKPQNIAQPDIRIISHKDKEIKIQQNTVVVKAEAHSKNDRIKKVWFRLNNKRVYDNENIKTTFTNDYLVKIEGTFNLNEKENIISVIASTFKTRSKTESIKFIIDTEDEPPDVQISDLNILSIGISLNSNNKYNREFTNNDAQEIVDFFKKQEGRLYKKIDSHILRNSEAKKENIQKELEWLKSKSSPKNLNIIFISAMGTDENDRYRIFPFDYDNNNYQSSLFLEDDIIQQLKHLKSITLMFLDIEDEDNDINFSNYMGINNAKNKCILVTTNSKLPSESLSNLNLKHSPLTTSIIKSIKSLDADTNKDNIIKFSELEHYLSKTVKQITHSKQFIKTLISPNIKDDFDIIKK